MYLGQEEALGGSKCLLSPDSFMLWPPQDYPFIPDSLDAALVVLDFQERNCTYRIRARDEQEQLNPGPCSLVLVPGV